MLWGSARPWEKRQELGGGRLVPPAANGAVYGMARLAAFPPAIILPAQERCLQPGYLSQGLTQERAGRLLGLLPSAPCKSYPMPPGTVLNAALCPQSAWGGLRQVSVSPGMGPACFWGPRGVQSPKLPPFSPAPDQLHHES